MSSFSWLGRHKLVARLAALAGVLLLALVNLTSYPTSWYDEGAYLHVPKTLIQYGRYAERSSEGFRYFSVSLGVGPTVLLPIAAMFKVFGISLWSARLVIVAYLIGSVICFFGLAKVLGGERLAWVATALLVASRGVSLLEFGREALGEVPGFFFVVAGLWVWFADWEHADWRRALAAGVLLGLATVTKPQYLIMIAPALALGWLANLIYYRSAPQRSFLIPGITLGLIFVAWQVFVIAFLGPGTFSANLASYREGAVAEAIVFLPNLMAASVRWLLSPSIYLGVLIPVLVYGITLAIPRQRDGQRWGLVMLMISIHLIWYVVFSVGWVRYAFLGVALSALCVARFFSDLTERFHVDWKALPDAWRTGALRWQTTALRVVLIGWVAVMIGVPLLQSLKDVLLPPPNSPQAMAAYMNTNVPRDAVVETWEPEMGFLTDHNYHYPPPAFVYRAVSYAWAGGPPPAEQYTFVQEEKPLYILAGHFSRGTGMYPSTWLDDYQRMVQIGEYELYARTK